MKLKKLLTVLGCFALVLMCAFTVVGCGEVEATAEEVNTFMANEAVVTEFKGINFNMDVSGKVNGKDVVVKMNGNIDESKNGSFTINYKYFEESMTASAYVDGTNLYINDGKTKTYVALDSLDYDNSSYEYYFNQVYGYLTDGTAEFMDLMTSEFGDALKIQKKGDAEKGNITFITYMDENGLFAKATVRFDNFKIAEATAESKMTMSIGSKSMSMSAWCKISTYTGTITLPTDLDTYKAA